MAPGLWFWAEDKPELLGLPFQPGCESSAMVRLLYGEEAFLIRLPGRQQMEHNASEFVGGGGDCPGGSEFGAHSTEELAEIGFIAMQRSRGHAQGDSRAAFDGASFCRQDLAATDAVVSGHRPSQEAKAAELGNLERSAPISVNRVCAVSALMPGISVRSTPKMRNSSLRTSKRGSLRRGL